jgi:hypothetical protein
MLALARALGAPLRRQLGQGDAHHERPLARIPRGGKHCQLVREGHAQGPSELGLSATRRGLQTYYHVPD